MGCLVSSYCGRSLQSGLLYSALVSWAVWMATVIAYPIIIINAPPYILKTGFHLAAQLGILMLLSGLMADSFLIIAVYRKYRHIQDFLLPWLAIYSIIIPSLVGFGGWCFLLPGLYKLLSLVPWVFACLYCWQWLAVASFHRNCGRTKNAVMRGLFINALQPGIINIKQNESTSA